MSDSRRHDGIAGILRSRRFPSISVRGEVAHQPLEANVAGGRAKFVRNPKTEKALNERAKLAQQRRRSNRTERKLDGEMRHIGSFTMDEMVMRDRQAGEKHVYSNTDTDEYLKKLGRNFEK